VSTFQLGAPPIGDVEWRIGEDVVRFEVWMLILRKGAGWFFAQVEALAPNGKVHCYQPPRRRVGLLAIDGDVTRAWAGDRTVVFRWVRSSTRVSGRAYGFVAVLAVDAVR
jgi:hypothetical protein